MLLRPLWTASQAPMRLNSLLFVVALSALLAGCGGGGGSSHGPVATETDFVSGDLVGRSAISSPPITTSSYNCTATGLVGTFTSLRLKESTSSLDETRLVFYSRTLDNNMEIYSCAVDGGDIQRLTNSPGDDFNASTSFAGKIAFATSREGPIRVYTMNLDGTNQVSIPSVPGANDYAPKWSLDGTKISYVSNRTGSPQIFVTDLTTLTTTQISNRSFAINAWQSLITSDNKWVFYNDSASIFKAPITGGSESPILTETAAIDCMSQAPDGSEMAEVVSGASTSKITRFSPYYPNARQIVSVPLTVIALTYSPDGKKFALSAYTGSNVVNLYTMNIDGTGLMRITNRAATFEYVSWSGFPKDRSLVAAS
ncbi:MAG: hypothetical protein QOJ65_2703, partial [Fimbriimonadaceae bacterium]|nr:hypothetical protein [Fimbriimonadaceae bacterium]